MNPVVGIKNNTPNSFLIPNNIQGEKLMIPKTLFDVKYENLKDTFIIENENKVYSFIKNNEKMLDMLEEVKPSLTKQFHGEKYYLEVRCYPEIFEKELALIIKVDYSKEDMKKLIERLLKVDMEIREYKIESNLLGKFFVDVEGI